MPTPQDDPSQWLDNPQYWQAPTDYDGHISAYDHRKQMIIGRFAFKSNPLITAAVKQIASFLCSRGLELTYKGPNAALGDPICNWFNNDFNSICNVHRYNFQAMAERAVMAVLNDGEILFVNRYTDKYAKWMLLESHRIGQRGNKNFVDDIHAPNWARGLYSVNGRILDDDGGIRGFIILGNKPDEDVYLSRGDEAELLYDTAHFSNHTGEPAIISGISALNSKKDLQKLYRLVAEVEAMYGVLVKNKQGQAPPKHDPRDPNGWAQYKVANNTDASKKNATPHYLRLNGPRVLYMETEEKIEPFAGSNRPSLQLMEFMRSFDKEYLNCYPWSYQYIQNPESIGGAGGAAVRSLCNGTLRRYGDLLNPFLLKRVLWAIAANIQRGNVPGVDKSVTQQDWVSGFELSRGGEMVMNESQERAADINDYWAGLKTRGEILAKYGKNVEREDRARFSEVSRSLVNAQELNKMFPWAPPMLCLDMLGKHGGNFLTVQAPVEEEKTEPAKEQTTNE